MEGVTEVGIHGHPGHDSGPGRCAVSGKEGVALPGELWVHVDTETGLVTLEACGPCLNALAGLSRLEGARQAPEARGVALMARMSAQKRRPGGHPLGKAAGRVGWDQRRGSARSLPSPR